MKRRGLLFGLLAMPVVIRTPGLLMPIKPVPTGATPLGGLTPVSAPPNQSTYKTAVLVTDFNSPSEMAAWRSGTAPWYAGGTESQFCSSGDWTIAGGTLKFLKGGPGYAAMAATACRENAPTSRPGAPVPTTAAGRLFQYGYFEAKFRVNSRPGPGWPSFWATPPDFVGDGDHLEIDFLESQGAGNYTCGFLSWFNNTTHPRGTYFGALNATGYPDWGQMISKSGIDTGNGWNVIGCHWTPTRLEFWWNSWARRSSGIADTLVSSYPTTIPLDGFIKNGSGGKYHGLITAANKPSPSSGVQVILGSAGTEFDWVQIFQ